jgi:alpha-tubulin suppressor-like RCC1 family protein
MRALLMLSLVAGCVEQVKCSPRTVLLSIDGAAGADALHVRFTVTGGATAQGDLPLGGRSGGNVEIDFDEYPAGAGAVWEVEAFSGMKLVLAQSGALTLSEGCSSIQVNLSSVSDLARVSDLGSDLVSVSDLGSDPGVRSDLSSACDRPCTGVCESCNLPGHEGVCTFLTGAGACQGGGTVCAGSCDGNHSECVYPTVSCAPARCQAGVSYPEALCDQGTCPSPTPTRCSPAICGATACARVAEISTYGSTACALLSDGTVDCWGDNTYGITGVSPSPAVNPSPIATPTQVPGISNATRLALGSGWGCVVLGDKTVKCWGGNNLSFLGIGTVDSDFHPPTRVLSDVATPLTDVTAIAASTTYTCAVTSGNNAWCWGYTDATTPGLRQASGFAAYYATEICARESANNGTCAAAADVAAIAPGFNHACYLATSGEVACWGSNRRGNCADPSGNQINTPKTLVGFSASRIAAGPDVSCAVDGSGKVWCWGDNSDGMLGQGTADSASHPSPSPVCLDAACTSSLTSVVTVSIGGHHACGLQSVQPVCWGRNDHGQLLSGDKNDRFFASNASNGLNEARISAGDRFTCVAAPAIGTMACWGADDKYQIGDGDTADKLNPTAPLLAQ